MMSRSAPEAHLPAAAPGESGADRLCETLLANEVDVCFANPGTSEMHFVAALDRQPTMHCVLGLFEGVVTGAADGWARMTGRPAATLLHLGPGLANGLANLHNARRAWTPVVNVVGDHATYHRPFDAPLTSDIDTLARPMSSYVGRADAPGEVAPQTEAAIAAARTGRGVATMILSADAAWGPAAPVSGRPANISPRRAVDDAAIDNAMRELRAASAPAILIGGDALHGEALNLAGRFAAATGARLLCQTPARQRRGAGVVVAHQIPYPVPLALEMLAPHDALILIGADEPVAGFAYPGRLSRLKAAGCRVVPVARPSDDLLSALRALADAAGEPSAPVARGILSAPDLGTPQGRLDATALSEIVARHLPEDAIVIDEVITSIGSWPELAPRCVPHDVLKITGGAIGIGPPLAVGAAVACPARKVVALQADGSAMYTCQALWTQAREGLDVLTIVFANRGYQILKNEMRNLGVEHYDANARRMLEIVDPQLDFCSLAGAMGVEAVRADNVSSFVDAIRSGLRRRGPFLIEARME